MNKNEAYQLIIDSLLVLKHQGYTDLSTSEFELFTALIDFVNDSTCSFDSKVESNVETEENGLNVVPPVPDSNSYVLTGIDDLDLNGELTLFDKCIQTMLLICKKNGDERQFTRLVQRWRALKNA